jgi:hypothetical protein
VERLARAVAARVWAPAAESAARTLPAAPPVQHKGRENLPACKPGSVEARSFGRSFLSERRHRRSLAAYPRRLDRSGLLLAAYSALLRLGFAVPLVLPQARWALTPPFHPCPRGRGSERGAVCFLWHYPSPCGSTVPRRYLAACPMSPDFPRNNPFGLLRDRPAGRSRPCKIAVREGGRVQAKTVVSQTFLRPRVTRPRAA